MAHLTYVCSPRIIKALRILLLVCLLLAFNGVSVGHAAVAIDTSIGCSTGMANPTLYASAAISATGNVYVLVGVTAYPGTPVSITDTKGSSYALVNTATANYAQTHVFLAQLAGDMVAWTDHIDINTNGNMADACAIVLIGLDANPLDGSATGNNNWSTAMSTAAVTPTTANTLLVGAFGWSFNTNNATPGASWSQQQQSGVLLLETRQVSAAGSYAASASLSGDDRWAGIVVALKVRAPQPPTDITLSSAALASSDPSGTLVGTLAAVDADTDETYTFSLVSGTGDTHNGSFAINGDELTTTATFAPGTYSIRVNVNDGLYNFAKAFSITVTAYPPITGGDTQYFDWITNVAFSDLDHASGDDSGYADYTAFAATVDRGSSYPLTVELTLGDSAYPAVVVAWIDWNQNYSFDDAGEKTVIGTNLNLTGANTASATVAVPLGAHTGATRMRVVMNAFDGVTEPPNAGLDEFYGDAEDYTINVSTIQAVSLASLVAEAEGAAIRVSWETAQELDNLGFNLYRGASPAGPWERLNAALIPSQSPGAVFGATYTWLDETVEPGQITYYRLEDVDIYGASTFHGPVSATAGAPAAVTLTGFDAQGSLPGVTLVLAGIALIAGWSKRR